ncbi:MAG: hypothetical protein Tsb009_02090 [Planctomycetaceae bacterium]
MVVFLMGCGLFPNRQITSPLSYREQVGEIQKIVSVGMPRDEVIRRLNNVGIHGDFSASGRSIYYCELWERKNGERWHLNVALLFDQDGRFYRTRHADFDAEFTTASVRPNPPEHKKSAQENTQPFTFPSGTAGTPVPFPAPQANENPPRRGDERRTPFIDRNDLR